MPRAPHQRSASHPTVLWDGRVKGLVWDGHSCPSLATRVPHFSRPLREVGFFGPCM